MGIWNRSLMSEVRGIDDNPLDLARSREVPAFFVVDEDLRVLYQPTAQTQTMDDTLPDSVASVVRQLLPELAGSREASAVGVVSPTQIVRLLRLEGEGAATHYAVLLERFAARASVAKAAAQYGLSKREAEVLGGLLRGESTNDLAARLDVAATTIQEHIRNIGHKTNVTKRSEIVATVFGLR